MEKNTVIQHTFLIFDQSKKPRFKKNPWTPDETEKPHIHLVKKNSSGNTGPTA